MPPMKHLIAALIATGLTTGCLGPYSASHDWAAFVREDVTETDLGAQAFYTATAPLAATIWAFDFFVYNPLTWLYHRGRIVTIPEGPDLPPRD